MAGGIDWFRWHHGSVTDPKFQLVARKSGASLPDVLAVWAFLLEQASASVVRGVFGSVDAEALDCLFGFPSTETRTADILAAMRGRMLIDETSIIGWEKRQVKREREGDDSSNRVREFREKKRHVTPCNASADQETPREEESREELKPIAQAPNGFARFWAAYPKKKSKGDAERAFKSIKPSEQLLGQMLSAIAKAKTSDDWKREAGQYIPYPATWLRAKSWEDEAKIEIGGAAPIKPVIEQVPSLAAIERRTDASDKAAEEARQKLRQIGRVRIEHA